jgi:hypothetical protein
VTQYYIRTGDSAAEKIAAEQVETVEIAGCLIFIVPCCSKEARLCQPDLEQGSHDVNLLSAARHLLQHPGFFQVKSLRLWNLDKLDTANREQILRVDMLPEAYPARLVGEDQNYWRSVGEPVI